MIRQGSVEEFEELGRVVDGVVNLVEVQCAKTLTKDDGIRRVCVSLVRDKRLSGRIYALVW